MTERLEASLNCLRSLVGNSQDYAIFGSTAFVLNELLDREPKDIDLMASKVLWGNLFSSNGMKMNTPKAGDPPFLSYSEGWHTGMTIPLSIFYDWCDSTIDIPSLINKAEIVKGLRVIPVKDAVYHKQEGLRKVDMASEKFAYHIDDLARIRNLLSEGGRL